ncbi:MAG: ComEC/Rec2 family competence protein [Actinomycetia bacterium]|nr:ComEC/Rec2 family competence protein [Actinomycetes bacterium]
MFMVGLMCGVFLGSMAHRMQSLRMATIATHNASPVTVRAVEDAYTSAYGTTQIVKVIEGSMRGMRIQFSYSEGVAPLERGQSASLSDMILPLARTEKSRTLYAKDIIGRAQVSSLDEYHYRGWMSPLYGYRALLAEQNIKIGQYSAITRGVLLGDRRGISDQLNDDLAQAGIRHFLTVSGTHIAVMSAGLIRLLSHTAFTRRQVQCIVLGAATVYVILVGYPSGAIRAMGMAGILFASALVRRRDSPLNSLSLTGMVWLCLDPFSAISLGFTLSVIALSGIIIYAGYGRWVADALLKPLPKKIRDDIALSGVVLAITAPVTSQQFGFISLVGPVANIIVTPLIITTLAIALHAALLFMLAPPIAYKLFEICALINQMTEGIAQYLASLSWASVPLEGGRSLTLMIVTVAIGWWWLWPRPSQKSVRLFGLWCGIALLTIGAIALGMRLLPSGTPHSSVIILDVGQGDAALIQSSGGVILVDAGPDPTLLRNHLRKNKVDHIDALIMTHDHEDHLDGASGLVKKFHVDTLFCAKGAQDSARLRLLAQELDAPLVALDQGDSITLGEITIEVWGPTHEVSDSGANESCLILKISADVTHENRRLSWVGTLIRPHTTIEASSLVMGGDAEAFSVRQAIDAQTDPQLPVEVLKAGHHGSKASIDLELLDLVEPETVIISVGRSNAYGHPSPEILDLCEKQGKRILRTDQIGSITIWLDKVADEIK